MGIKYKVNENFFNIWTSKMAYILGYLYADGSLEDASYLRGKYVRVTSIDKLTIENIRKILQSEHKIVILKPPKNTNGKIRYFLRIGSHALYESLLKLGLYPNKSLTIKFPDIPNIFLADFIRGYFDGDGCVHIEMAEGIKQKKILKRMVITFTSGSLDFLEKMNYIIKKELNLNQGSVYYGHRSFQLKYNTAASIEVFKFLYSSYKKDLFLKRKFNIFRKYFKLRPQRIDYDIACMLRKYGAVAK